MIFSAVIFWTALVCLSCSQSGYTPTLQLPPRSPNAAGGSEIAQAVGAVDLDAREEILFAEIAQGNVPSWMRALKPVEISHVIDGKTYRITFWVTPDYLAVGSDDDNLRVPLSPRTAQRIADLAGATLPTSRMVDAVWSAADVRLTPLPIPPSEQMTTISVFVDHNRMIQAQWSRRSEPPGSIVAGHKKDVVITTTLESTVGNVAIYGWHQLDGRPIQPLYTGHSEDWVDYSHGVRLVNRAVCLNGVKNDIEAVLSDETLAILLSYDGVIMEPRYSNSAH